MKKQLQLRQKERPSYRDKMKLYFLAFLFMLTAPCIFAQQLTIKGRVIDPAGEPLIGVTVGIEGTTRATMTDIDGRFSFNVEQGETISVSYVGFVPQKIKIDKADELNITLREKAQQLDEVIVVGYGTTTRKHFTGAVTQVKMDNSPLSLIPSNSALDALRGTTPGMDVSQQQGAGQNPSMLVRGQKSLNSNNTNPLIVLDGVVFMGNMRDIDPSTIESMSILKDATSIAVYGSRAANGVLMINTKKGKLGKPVVTFNLSLAFSRIANKPDLLSPENYIKKVNAVQGLAEDTDPLTWMTDFEKENYQNGKTTDWVDLASHTGLMQTYSVSVSGATEKVNYFMSGAFTDQDGVLKGDKYKRQVLTSRLSSDITSWMQVGADVDFSFSNYSGPTDYNLYSATRLTPYGRAYRPNGELEKFPRQEGIYMTNPLWLPESNTVDDHDTYKSYRTKGHLLLKCPWLVGLNYRLNFSYSNEYIDRDLFYHEDYYIKEGQSEDRYSPEALVGLLGQANGSTTRIRNSYWVMDNIISYANNFGKHFVDATLVYTRDSYSNRKQRTDGSNFTALGNTILGYNGLAYAEVQKFNTINKTKQNNIGYLARINYSYDDRYHLTAAIRRDGASVLGANSKWDNFPSVGLAWTASKETFLKDVKPINYLKLKTSWGVNGNQSLDPYSTLSRVAMGQTGGFSYPFGNTGKVSWAERVNSMGNPDLTWEKTYALNWGAEVNILNNRIGLVLDTYKSRTYNQIFNRTIPVMGNGMTSMLTTMGRVDNWGIETTLNTVNYSTKDFEWRSSLTYYINRNRLKKLYGDGKDDITNSLFLNRSLGAIYGYKPIGIVQEDNSDYIKANGAKPGDVMFANIDGSEDGKITSADRTILGYRKENFRMSFGNTLSYKNLELYFLFTGIFGGGKYYREVNQYAYRTASDVVWDNNLNHGWWTPENKSNKYPRANYTDNRYIPTQSRTFVRLQDLSLSYTLPKSLINTVYISNMKVYFAAKNLFTITDWDGGDPEIAQTIGTGYKYDYPLSRTFSFGLNISF